MNWLAKWLIEQRATCPNCGFSYDWQTTEPGECDGCGYPNQEAMDS